MDVPRFLALAVELETEISRLYEDIANSSADLPIAVRLKSISHEETNHANIIRSGLKYYEALPDLFTGVTMDEAELRAGLEEMRAFKESLRPGRARILDNLKRLLEFERRFEKLHMGASVKTTDASLKVLFSSLSKGDQSHIVVLRTLIDSLGGLE